MPQLDLVSPPDPSDDIIPDFQAAWQEWKALRTLLSETIQKYSDACSTLNITWRRSLRQPSGERLIKNAHADISSELLSLPLHEETLRKARLSLSSLTNGLSSVHKLPPEILGDIFMMAKQHCVHDVLATPSPRRYLDTISRISTEWRRVAINTPALWTHIDVSPNIDKYRDQFHHYSQLVLERSCGLRIHLHVHESAQDGGHSRANDDQVFETTTFLAPLMIRASALKLDTYSFSRRFANSILESWLRRGSPSTTRMLSVFRPNGQLPLDLTNARNAQRNHEALSPQRGEDILPTRILRLQDTLIPWSNPMCHGLVELQLQFQAESGSLSVLQFAQILAANPSLTILKLDGLTLVPSTDWDAPASVHLHSLSVLKIAGIPGTLHLLLPLLLPLEHVNNLSVGFGAHLHLAAPAELEAFFRRSCITTLFVEDFYSHDGARLILTFLGWLPTLHTLGLKGYDIRAYHLPSSSNPSLNVAPAPIEPKQSPHLLELFLVDCHIHLTTLKWFILACGVRILHLDACTIFSEVDRTSTQGQDPGLREFRASLLEASPQLECIVSDTDSTTKWSCRIMTEEW